MGTTLTHNVYLPDEGERNCYSGLANNWQILDDAVGAIAGKANASHTHGNITNGGAIGSTSGLPIITGTDGVLTTGTFGNTAGTFCEGNDSRLSDARTPVAHTHTKSDVTDLLNSNFIPSANNTYDLGSSSYQWNNAYIKSLTINGVACGDILTHNASEFVDITSAQTIDGSKTFTSLVSKSNTLARGALPTTSITEDLIFGSVDKNIRRTLAFYNYYYTSGDGKVVLYAYNQNTTNYDNIGLAFDFDNTNSSKSICPAITNSYSLGSSSYKWKDCYTNAINGINPGALSLPSTSADPIDTTGWDLTGTTSNPYTATEDGWISIGVRFNRLTFASVLVAATGGSTYAEQTMVPNPAGTGVPTYHFICVPIRAGQTAFITIICSLITYANFFPCEGNV